MLAFWYLAWCILSLAIQTQFHFSLIRMKVSCNVVFDMEMTQNITIVGLSSIKKATIVGTSRDVCAIGTWVNFGMLKLIFEMYIIYGKACS